jgi:hypothetical protein
VCGSDDVPICNTPLPARLTAMYFWIVSLASELSVSYEKRPILTNVAYSVVFGKSPPFFVFGGPF